MLNRKLSARIAGIFLILHGLIEVAGLAFIDSISLTLIGFGGVTGPALERNAPTIAVFGVLWGIARLVAAWGIWSLRKWGLVLGMTLSILTMLASITIIPAGVMDSLFAIPALIFLLYTWFGDEVKEIS